jgi:hypothetical protein
LEKGCPETVKELLLPGGGAWNEAKLREFFHDHDVEDILWVDRALKISLLGIIRRMASSQSGPHTIWR